MEKCIVFMERFYRDLRISFSYTYIYRESNRWHVNFYTGLGWVMLIESKKIFAALKSSFIVVMLCGCFMICALAHIWHHRVNWKWFYETVSFTVCITTSHHPSDFRQKNWCGVVVGIYGALVTEADSSRDANDFRDSRVFLAWQQQGTLKQMNFMMFRAT